MSNFDLKIGKKYQVKGFNKPVELISISDHKKAATVKVDGHFHDVWIDDILEPVLDGLLSLLGRWIMSLFKK